MDIDQLVRALAILAIGVIAAGLAGLTVRRLVAKSSSPAVARSAGDAASLTLWVVLAAAVAITIGFLSPGALTPLPTLILRYLPRVLAAGLILIGGRVLAVVASRLVGRASEQAAVSSTVLSTGVRWTILGLAIVLALGQLGIQTVILQILAAGLIGGVALAFALMTGLGARDVAASIAAGRVLRRQLTIGDQVTAGAIAGVVESLGPASIAVRLPDGGLVHLSYARALDSPLRVDERA